MRKKRFLSACLVILVSAAACFNEEGVLENDEDIAPVDISLVEEPEVRSVLAESLLDQIKSFGLYVYNSKGHLEQAVTSDGSKVTVNLNRSMTYTIYALANIPQLPEAPAEESEFIETLCTVPYDNLVTTGIPMSGRTFLDPESILSGSTEISLTRLITRVAFSVDKSELTSSDLTVTSVKLCQTAAVAAPFKDSFAPDEAMVETEGDYVSEADLQSLNAGGSVWLYCLENCQGALLPDNDDPWQKVPSEISDASGRCTYIEVCARYSGDYEGVEVSSDNVVYRLYLGKDNVTDFTLERNKGVLVSLTVSDSGVFEREWKVDYGQSLPVVTASLDVIPSETSIRVEESTGLKVYYSKYVDGVLSCRNDVTSEASWSVDDETVASLSDAVLTGADEGTVTVTATCQGVSGNCSITVKPPLGKIIFMDEPVWMYPYKQQNVYFTYSNLSPEDLDAGCFSAFGCDIMSVTILNGSEGYVTVSRGLVAAGTLLYDNPTGGENAEKELVSKTPELTLVGPERVMQAAPCSYYAEAWYEWPDGLHDSEVLTTGCTWNVNGSWPGSSDGNGNYYGLEVDPDDGDGNIYSTVRSISCSYHGALAEKDVLVYMYSDYSFNHVMYDSSWDMEYYTTFLQRNVYDAKGKIQSMTANVPYSWRLSLTQGDYYGEDDFTYRWEFNKDMEYVNLMYGRLYATFSASGEYKEDGTLWNVPSSIMEEVTLSGF